MTNEQFFEKLNIPLNEQQRKAVIADNGSVLVLAVPGSGKTTVLVARLGYLILCRGILPEDILTMTYTASAAGDMRERFRNLFGSELADRMEFRTINGVCVKIIMYFEKLTGRKAFDLITDERTSTALLSKIYKECTREYPDESSIKELKKLIAYCKNMLLPEKEIKEFDRYDLPFSTIYNKYKEALQEQKLMDYDDQLVYAYTILTQYKNILDHFQNKYKCICVDEAQDTSKIQHMITQKLSEKHQNLFMVGDEDQSIYGFRAAYPEALLDFENEYKNASVLLMEENYRSCRSIVDSADKFIKNNKLRHDKNMVSTRPLGGMICEIDIKSPREQYKYIFNSVKNLTEQTAVLYRNNESAIPLIDLLEKNGVQYNLNNTETIFFSNKIVRDITNIINFCSDTENADLFMLVYSKIDLYISKEIAEYACFFAKINHCSIIEALLCNDKLPKFCIQKIKNLKSSIRHLITGKPKDAIKTICEDMGYSDYINLSPMKSKKLEILNMIAENQPDIPHFLERINMLEQTIKTKKHCLSPLTLSTIHSAKGLEYDNVYLLDVYDGVFPEKLSVNNIKDLKEFEEERRIFYVGITRAKNALNIFSVKNNPSVFIDELLQRNDRRKKSKSGSSTFIKNNRIIPTQTFSAFSEMLAVDQRIKHKTFGEGIIKEKSGDIITVEFAKSDVKKLSVKFLYKNGLLTTVKE
ncbi:MAG: ATP-dependent helicase [Clostridiales bacterium]|nr:ATP-dependent helicase [Clostridiales bacterium]